MAATRTYASPPYTGPAPRPREDWDREYLQAVAAAGVADSFALVGSRAHVEAICEDYGQVHGELLDARDHLQAVMLELDASRAAGVASAQMADDQLALRIAESAESNRLRRLAAQLTAENATLRIQAGLNTLALTVTGRSAAELSAEHAELDRVEREHQRAMACKATRLERSRATTVTIEQRARLEVSFHSGAILFDVSDTDVVDEPVPGRTQTRRTPDALTGFGRAP